MKTPSPWML